MSVPLNPADAWRDAAAEHVAVSFEEYLRSVSEQKQDQVLGSHNAAKFRAGNLDLRKLVAKKPMSKMSKIELAAKRRESGVGPNPALVWRDTHDEKIRSHDAAQSAPTLVFFPLVLGHRIEATVHDGIIIGRECERCGRDELDIQTNGGECEPIPTMGIVKKADVSKRIQGEIKRKQAESAGTVSDELRSMEHTEKIVSEKRLGQLGPDAAGVEHARDVLSETERKVIKEGMREAEKSGKAAATPEEQEQYAKLIGVHPDSVPLPDPGGLKRQAECGAEVWGVDRAPPHCRLGKGHDGSCSEQPRDGESYVPSEESDWQGGTDEPFVSLYESVDGAPTRPKHHLLLTFWNLGIGSGMPPTLKQMRNAWDDAPQELRDKARSEARRTINDKPVDCLHFYIIAGSDVHCVHCGQPPPGDDKTVETCREKFDSSGPFKGAPEIPKAGEQPLPGAKTCPHTISIADDQNVMRCSKCGERAPVSKTRGYRDASPAVREVYEPKPKTGEVWPHAYKGDEFLGFRPSPDLEARRKHVKPVTDTVAELACEYVGIPLVDTRDAEEKWPTKPHTQTQNVGMYSQWLAQQTYALQDLVLGKERAERFRKGGDVSWLAHVGKQITPKVGTGHSFAPIHNPPAQRCVKCKRMQEDVDRNGGNCGDKEYEHWSGPADSVDWPGAFKVTPEDDQRPSSLPRRWTARSWRACRRRASGAGTGNTPRSQM